MQNQKTSTINEDVEIEDELKGFGLAIVRVRLQSTVRFIRRCQGACKTYYISLRNTERRKLSGKKKNTTREADAKAEDGKEQPGDYMSSEESEEDEAGEFSHFSVRRLPWQKEAFQTLKDRLEEIHNESLTPSISDIRKK
uniref:Uncharacterized protein n=1 Tax=Magallana gigas TaxID=29159 RepID=A0A8W8MF59_MAGGI